MKAFLSHSSKDKTFVRKVADRLGGARCEYDEYSFEYDLNSQAIRRALVRSDLFVLFLSENSTKSGFVNEEIRSALDFRSQGSLRKVLIFPLDDTSYSALPDWLRATNVVIPRQNDCTIARKIEAELFALEAETGLSRAIVIPREEEERELLEAMSRAPGVAPVAIHIIGHVGVGRKTLLRKVLQSVFPRKTQTFISIALDNFDGINEFYRRLYELFATESLVEQIDRFEHFALSSEDAQVEILADLVVQIFESDEFVLVEDEGGGVYTDEGDYKSFFAKLIESLRGANRPVAGFIQTRMMPPAYRHDRTASFHLRLNPMNETKISQLMSFTLREAEIDFSREQLEQLCALVDGTPINVKLAMNVIKAYGLSIFLADPSLLIEWKRRRAEDFLSKVKFEPVETDVLAVLFDYRVMSFETLSACLSGELEPLVVAIRKLEDYCCIERRGLLYAVSSPLHDAIGRDKRFTKPDEWRKAIALKLVQAVSDYREEDRAPVALMEAAAFASIIAGKSHGLTARFILPSYYLTIAQRSYNEGRYPAAIDFCKQAWDREKFLSLEGKIETLRLWGLSAARLRDRGALDFVLNGLDAIKSNRVAKRHWYFLRGFSQRLQKHFDDAERDFLSAYALAPKNMSINRELANLYRQQSNYVEAEGYARAAYNIAPTNPYILDVLLESLLGKAAAGQPVDQLEIDNLLSDLSRYGDVPGSSFYQTRLAHNLSGRDKRAALVAATKAVERTPEFLPCRYLRADIYLSLSNARDARKDLEAINKILERRGGFYADEEGKVVDLEVRVLTEERRFKEAREKLQTSQFLPHRVKQRLSGKLAAAIKHAPGQVDQRSLDWAQKFQS